MECVARSSRAVFFHVLAVSIIKAQIEVIVSDSWIKVGDCNHMGVRKN